MSLSIINHADNKTITIFHSKQSVIINAIIIQLQQNGDRTADFPDAFGHFAPSPTFSQVVVGWAKKEKGVSPLIFKNFRQCQAAVTPEIDKFWKPFIPAFCCTSYSTHNLIKAFNVTKLSFGTLHENQCLIFKILKYSVKAKQFSKPYYSC